MYFKNANVSNLATNEPTEEHAQCTYCTHKVGLQNLPCRCMSSCVCVCVCVCVRESTFQLVNILVFFSVVFVANFDVLMTGVGLTLKALWLKASHFHRHDR